jgi:hypothetical protein
VVLVRNGGMKHAHHMKGEFCLWLVLGRACLISLCCLFIR